MRIPSINEAPTIGATMGLFNKSEYNEKSVSWAIKGIGYKRDEMNKFSPNRWITKNLAERILLQAQSNGLNMGLIKYYLTEPMALLKTTVEYHAN